MAGLMERDSGTGAPADDAMVVVASWMLGHAAPKVHAKNDEYGYATNGDAEGQGQRNGEQDDRQQHDFLAIVLNKAKESGGTTQSLLGGTRHVGMIVKTLSLSLVLQGAALTRQAQTSWTA